MIQFSEKIDKNFWAQTFSTRSLPGPDFFKPSVPGLHIFLALRVYFLQICDNLSHLYSGNIFIFPLTDYFFNGAHQFKMT